MKQGIGRARKLSATNYIVCISRQWRSFEAIGTCHIPGRREERAAGRRVRKAREYAAQLDLCSRGRPVRHERRTTGSNVLDQWLVKPMAVA